MFNVFRFCLRSCILRCYTFEQQDLARRIRVCTPEGAQGETFTNVVFLALQRRHKDEREPRGHSDQVARRLVALTRASRTLVVLGEAMSCKSYTGPTRLLQSELDSSPHRVRLLDHKAGGTGRREHRHAYLFYLLSKSRRLLNNFFGSWSSILMDLSTHPWNLHRMSFVKPLCLLHRKSKILQQRIFLRNRMSGGSSGTNWIGPTWKGFGQCQMCQSHVRTRT